MTNKASRSVESLQKRRVALVRQHQGHQATIRYYLDRLVIAVRKADEVEGKVAIIDVTLNDLMDKAISRIETEYADEG